MPIRARRLLIAFALLLTAAAGHAQEVLPIPVFVTHLETPPMPPLKPEQHVAEISRTKNKMFDVAAELRKEHGDKTKAWPPEVWNVFYIAEDAHQQAVARRDYQPAETRLGLDDSVQDFLRGVGGNKGMMMVTSAADAALVVHITGRRRVESVPGPTDNRYFIRFRLAPGSKMTGERFAELTRGYKWDTPWATLITHAKDASGYVELEAGSMASYKNCAGMVRAIVELFIRKQMGPARSK
jgi:hypothetical protein